MMTGCWGVGPRSRWLRGASAPASATNGPGAPNGRGHRTALGSPRRLPGDARRAGTRVGADVSGAGGAGPAATGRGDTPAASSPTPALPRSSGVDGGGRGGEFAAPATNALDQLALDGVRRVVRRLEAGPRRRRRRPRRRWCRSGLPGQWSSASASGAMCARGLGPCGHTTTRGRVVAFAGRARFTGVNSGVGERTGDGVRVEHPDTKANCEAGTPPGRNFQGCPGGVGVLHVANGRLRHMLIGYAHVSKTDGSQLLDLERDTLRAAGIDDAANPLPRPRLRRPRRPAGTRQLPARPTGWAGTSPTRSRPPTRGRTCSSGGGI